MTRSPCLLFLSLSPVDPSEMSGPLKNCAHNVSRASDKDIKSRKGWKLKTDEDVAKFQKLLCSAQHKNPEKAIKRLEQDDAIDNLARIIDRKGSRIHNAAGPVGRSGVVRL